MLKQGLTQRLQQKLSPQQIQLMKLLQIPTALLDQRIKEEMEINPALEENAYGFQEIESRTIENNDKKTTDTPSSTPTDINNNNNTENDNNFEYNEFEGYEMGDATADYSSATTTTDDPYSSNSKDDLDLTGYFDENDDDIAAYKLRDDSANYNPDDEERNRETPIVIHSTFHENLQQQLSETTLNEHQLKICTQIIGSIDEDGYLRREIDAIVDDLAFSQNIQTTEDEVLELLKIIQNFDPPGIGAQNLQECLLLQIRRKIKLKDKNTDALETAHDILQIYFDEFAKKHYEKLTRNLAITDADLKKAIEEILKLNPKPGGMFENSTTETYIVPDFIINNQNGKLELSLNSKNAPDLRVSDSYKEMLRDYSKSKTKSRGQKEAVLFIKQKIDSAKWFIDAIKQRQKTLLDTMQSIMEHQYEYFLTGDETKLKPMILKDISEITLLDVSTISRVSNSKYVQTEFGTFKLKSFFSESLQTDTGDEVSTREVKKILSEMVNHEIKQKPLSDEKLTQMLMDKGYNIARRTVAKYREQLGIPVARLRKEL